MGHHVFVAMPFGTKNDIDFNAVYSDLIKAALEGNEFSVFRADEETRAGDIRGDMFQELLLADVVVVDLSIDNPNVWYELGVRHALRARGVILIGSRPGSLPFDVATDRKLRYSLKDGAPDPAYIEHDKRTLTRMAHDTVTAWHGRVVSPVYNLLQYLEEPNWKSLRVGSAREFWSQQEDWERRVEIARSKERPGDILMLAEEAPIQGLRLEAYRIAARALRQLEQFDFALEQIDRALKVNPDDLASGQEKGILLGRLGLFAEAKEWLKMLARVHPHDAETCGLLGRVEKDSWINLWLLEDASSDEMREAAGANIGMLREAITSYTTGFRKDATNYYCGINAVTLLHVARHLAGQESEVDRTLRTEMEGGVRWASRAALSRESSDRKDFWARVTLADLAVLLNDTSTVKQAYQYAIAAADRNWFSLNSTRQQLILLRELGLRYDEVSAAIQVIQRPLNLLKPPYRPRKVFVFSGHMVDAPDRDKERFPTDMEDLAVEAIRDMLDSLATAPGDLALCEGACGGDLLFARAALDRQLDLELRLPFEEPLFLQESVAFAGQKWVDLYFAVKSHPATLVLTMPKELGPTPEKEDAYERANLWQLYSALACGTADVTVVALWDGEASGKRGGTDHMVRAVAKRAGTVRVIDARALLLRTVQRRRAAE